MFSIHSLSSDRQLIFSPYRERDKLYIVEVKSVEISALTVFDHDPSNSGSDTLCDFFLELARAKVPWQGTREWLEDYRQRLEISASCTMRGHVIFWVKMADRDSDSPEQWEVQFGLETALGDLDTIAQNALEFFKGEVP
jgi:hypothetical protein